MFSAASLAASSDSAAARLLALLEEPLALVLLPVPVVLLELLVLLGVAHRSTGLLLPPFQGPLLMGLLGGCPPRSFCTSSSRT